MDRGSVHARSLVAAAALVLCGAIAPAHAVVEPIIRTGPFSSTVQGEGWTANAGQPVHAVLRAAGGALKAECRVKVGPSGYWNCLLGEGNAQVLAGDSVETWIGGVSQGSAMIPTMVVTRIGAAADVVRGRIAPAAAADLVLTDLLFTPAGQDRATKVIALTLDAAGRFEADTTGDYDILRSTGVGVRTRTGFYELGEYVQTPTIGAEVQGNTCHFSTLRPGLHVVTLRSRAGRVKAIDRVVVGVEDLTGGVAFANRRGPVPIRPSDRIVVSGPTDIAVTVPAMSVAADTALDSVSGTATPETTVQVSVTVFDDFGSATGASRFPTTDAAGAFAASFAKDLRAGDVIGLWFRDKKGNFFTGRYQILASP